jgi:4-diphosphocytidyl-2-C-methyl-D-erythritol kinase
VKILALNSYAKLNLFLQVVNKRSDNYHNLNTVFERVSLSDKIILKPRGDKKIRIICEDTNVPKGKSNLCYQSALVLRKIFKIDNGLDIKIIKHIPVGAGLGGGSSNAATVLLGLNKLWKLDLTRKRLVEIAKNIGCDVPFFIFNASFASASGRGDEIKLLGALKDTKLWHVLVVPNLTVSTPFIYKKWDKDSRLTMPKFDVKLLTPLESLTEALRKNDLFVINEFLFNSLEPVTVKYYPKVGNIINKLIKSGLKTILMSGSGPAVFAVVSSRKEAINSVRKFKEKNKGLKVFIVRTT